jgi:hypothetical protein
MVVKTRLVGYGPTTLALGFQLAAQQERFVQGLFGQEVGR